MQNRPQTHIQVVEANSSEGGSDYVIGDVHGDITSFNIIAKALVNPGDRLFIVGDLVDRGSANTSIIKAIIDTNADRNACKIYCVRGNHEDLCLDAINALYCLTEFKFMVEAAHASSKISYLDLAIMKVCNILKKKSKEDHPAVNHFITPINRLLHDDEDVTIGKEIKKLVANHEINSLANVYAKNIVKFLNTLHLHFLNGGEWLLELFIIETMQGKIHLDTDGGILTIPNSKIRMIEEYLNKLPYIIHVTGDRPFNVVHADMPISDEELQMRISNNQGLSRAEIEHATWAREDAIEQSREANPSQRTADSIATYVGHNTNGGVRPETKIFNLDVGAYITKSPLLLNHTHQTCRLLNFNDQENIKSSLLRIQEETQAHLERSKISPRPTGLFSEKTPSRKKMQDSGDHINSMKPKI